MGYRQREPPIAPLGLWERPEMARALAARDIGAVIRIFRQWTGASQTDISTLAGIPQPHVSELERGKRRVTSLQLFERFADGLRIPRVLLGLTAEPGSKNPAGAGMNYRTGEPDERVAASHREWLATREILNRHRTALTQAAFRLYPTKMRLGSTGLLTQDFWRLPAPVDLSTVHLTWDGHATPPTVNGQQAEVLPVLSLHKPGRHYTRYHRAMHDLDRPRLFENRPCYRLLAAQLSPPGSHPPVLRLTLGSMSYFDMIDVGEALAHETALAAADPHGIIRKDHVAWSRLPFRRLVRDPFTLAGYPLMLSVSTLTIRKSTAGSTFYLLRRNPAKVAVAGGMLSVFPTGVFQPATITAAPASSDFDLWRNIMREYSEEYLGNPEHDGDGPPIDYANTEPFRSLDAARTAGRIRVSCLGIGIDALNYVGDVLTVAVFDADVFDDIFHGMVQQNDEGDVAGEHGHAAFNFDGTTIQQLLTTEPFAPSGAACVHLAWKHHKALT